MSKKPEERYQTSKELSKDIKAAIKSIKDHQSGVRYIQVKTDSTGFVCAGSTTSRRMKRPEQKKVNIPVIVMSVMAALLGFGFFIGYLIISSGDE